MQSKATTVQQYLAELPPDRRAAIQALREVILRNLDKGYEEGMQYGMIGYHVPHRIFPAGYHCDPKQPLPFAALASQKNYMAVYLWSVYADGPEERWFREAWARTGRKLDMGKCCVRFKKLEDAALDVIGEAIRRVPMKVHIAQYQASLENRVPRSAGEARSAARGGKSKAKTASAGAAATSSRTTGKKAGKPSSGRETARKASTKSTGSTGRAKTKARAAK